MNSSDMTPWANVGVMDTRGSMTSAVVREPESSDENEPSAKLARVEETPHEIVSIADTPVPSPMDAAEITLGSDIEPPSAPIATPKCGVAVVVRMVRKDGQWTVGSRGDSVSTNLQTGSSSSDDDEDSDDETSPVVNDEVSCHGD